VTCDDEETEVAVVGHCTAVGGDEESVLRTLILEEEEEEKGGKDGYCYGYDRLYSHCCIRWNSERSLY
jgi:hypothetical protein